MTSQTIRTERLRGNASLASVAIRAILVHPAALSVKHVLRDMKWRIKGAGLANPPHADRVQSVLFVCLGNICRSPFAAGLASRLAAESGREDIRFTSAGIRTSQAERSPEAACGASATYGVDLHAHEPRALTPDLMYGHDAVVVMEASHLWRLRAEYRSLYGRIFLLALFDERPEGAYERCNIADPFGSNLMVFGACYDRIARALRCWLSTLPSSVVAAETCESEAVR